MTCFVTVCYGEIFLKRRSCGYIRLKSIILHWIYATNHILVVHFCNTILLKFYTTEKEEKFLWIGTNNYHSQTNSLGIEVLSRCATNNWWIGKKIHIIWNRKFNVEWNANKIPKLLSWPFQYFPPKYNFIIGNKMISLFLKL